MCIHTYGWISYRIRRETEHVWHAHFDESKIYWNFASSTTVGPGVFFFDQFRMRLWAVWEKASRTAPAVLMPRSEAHLKEYWPVWWLLPFHPIIWENFVVGLWSLYSSHSITPSSFAMGTSKCKRWYDPRIFRVMLPAIPCPRSIVALYELADIRTVDEGLMRLGG